MGKGERGGVGKSQFMWIDPYSTRAVSKQYRNHTWIHFTILGEESPRGSRLLRRRRRGLRRDQPWDRLLQQSRPLPPGRGAGEEKTREDFFCSVRVLLIPVLGAGTAPPRQLLRRSHGMGRGHGPPNCKMSSCGENGCLRSASNAERRLRNCQIQGTTPPHPPS